MSGSGPIVVSEIPSQRWELALDCLESGEAEAFLTPSVGLLRYAKGPQADGQIHVSIYTQASPRDVTAAYAQTEVDAGLNALRRATDSDARLQALFDRFGVIVEYVFDLGKGAALAGHVDSDGVVHLV